MLPTVEVPLSVQEWMDEYRSIFCRDAGFDHVNRYVTGLLLSPNKTLQGIYDLQCWGDVKPSRRAMHEAVFEAGRNSEDLMPRHQTVIAKDHCGRGREVISLDWTLCRHKWGPHIHGVHKGYDYVEDRYCLLQTVLTATIANPEIIDGIDIVVQKPGYEKKEKAYLNSTVEKSYEEMLQVQTRLAELLHFKLNRLQYKTRTDLFVEMVSRIEKEGAFPHANYAFDNGVLSFPLAQLIEKSGKQWVSESEISRNIMWKGKWDRVDNVAKMLRVEHPETFRPVWIRCRNGKKKQYWAFTKVVRLKKYGKKRLVILHEEGNLTDKPRFLLSSAIHWESGRIIETWNYRWSIEIFHEFSKQQTGLESAQLRNQEAVERHFRLSCVAQSILQRVSAPASTSEKFEFANGKTTIGQKWRTIARESFRSLLLKISQFVKDGMEIDYMMEVLMPA
jgi:hypothetical protein